MMDASLVSPEGGIHSPGGVRGDFRWCVEEPFFGSSEFIFMVASSLQQVTSKSSFLNACK